MTSFDEGQLRGILHHVGKAVARMPDARAQVERLQEVDTADGLEEFLAKDSLDVEPKVKKAVLDYVAEEWDERKAELDRAARDSLTDRLSPGS